MAVDKLVDSTQLNSDLTSVANAIRTKGGTSASLAFPADFITAINAISGGGGIQHKTGTFTPTTSPGNNTNVEITTISAIGFTPKIFVLYPSDLSDVSGVQYAEIFCLYFEAVSIRLSSRYTNTTNTLGTASIGTSWTSQSNQQFYLDNGKIYYRNATAFTLIANVDYTWEAYA